MIELNSFDEYCKVKKLINELSVIKTALNSKIDEIKNIVKYDLNDMQDIQRFYIKHQEHFESPIDGYPNPKSKLVYDDEDENRLQEIMLYVDTWEGVPSVEELEKAKKENKTNIIFKE